MQKEMNDLKQSLKRDNKEVRSHLQHFYQGENTSKVDFQNFKTKVELLSNVVIRLEEKLDEANGKLLDMQTCSMRKNVIISGLDESKNETNAQLQTKIEHFIKEKLQVEQEVPFKVYHRLNYTDGSECRPVIVKLTSVEHKILLLSHGPNLKGIRNQKNRSVYINEQLPDKYAEERRYAQLWLADNKNKSTEDQLQMKIHRNKLRINNQPYQRKVSPPSAAEILRMDSDELATARKAPTVLGDSKLVDGSEFISYAVAASNVEDIRMAYRKLRSKYADATHIVSAFRLDPANGPFNQEASDDGEHAAGRCLLKLLQDNQIVNAAVFIIRFYGGKHIGSARFDIFKQLAITALHNAGLIRRPQGSQASQHKTTQIRRQTRSMSVRGRGGNSYRIPDRNHTASEPRPQVTKFRATPATSPTVSPTHIQIGLDPSHINSDGTQSASEYEDLLSAREEDEASLAASTHPSEADNDSD